VPALSRIIFWQPIDSPHQDEFLEAVAARFAGEVILGVERPFPQALAAQGWRAPAHGLVKVVNISRPAHHAALAAHTGEDSLHVFSGFFSHPLVWAGFRKLAPSPARLAIYSEAPEQPLLTGWLKRLRGRLLAARWADRIAFVLAIGGTGHKFFNAVGFPAEKIVPFGYYLAAPPLAPESPISKLGGPFRFISAGQLIRRKGVDLLIEACVSLPQTGWQLDIYGDGPERAALERLVAGRGLADRIVFHGTIPNKLLREVLAAADCAVLPSRFDGWGMLVSEALAAGTPAICTDRCGSADLLRQCQMAWAVAAPDVTELSAALARTLAAGPPSAASRRRVHESAALAGSVVAGASCLVDVVHDTVTEPLIRRSPAILSA